MLFELQPQKANINDINSELINCYKVVRDLYIDLIEDLKKHKNTKEYFYEIRKIDRTNLYNKLSPVRRASRTIYLNKTCFNGLFRVNSKGYFNVPFGNYSNPNIVNCEVILAINNYFSRNEIIIKNEDFSEIVKNAQQGDFIYFDPPYDPLSTTASFTSYSKFQFGRIEQVRLKETIDELTIRGCYVMLSNSSTDFIQELYSNYKLIKIQANRNINSVGSKRGKIDELLILNYLCFALVLNFFKLSNYTIAIFLLF